MSKLSCHRSVVVQCPALDTQICPAATLAARREEPYVSNQRMHFSWEQQGRGYRLDFESYFQVASNAFVRSLQQGRVLGETHVLP